MTDESLTRRIERAIAERVELDVVAEDSDGTIVLTGLADTAEDRQAALEVAAEIAAGRRIDDNIEVQSVVPELDFAMTPSTTGPSEPAETVEELRAAGGEIEPDFTEQPILTDPIAAGGPSESSDDIVQEGETYIPPTDPVIGIDDRGAAQVLGGFSPTSADTVEVERSTLDNQLGDEAIADAIRQELREDAATTNLEVRVTVRQGIAHLRGTVPGMEDVENAESVAGRVPGVREVVEELEVAEL